MKKAKEALAKEAKASRERMEQAREEAARRARKAEEEGSRTTNLGIPKAMVDGGKVVRDPKGHYRTLGMTTSSDLLQELKASPNRRPYRNKLPSFIQRIASRS